MNKIEAMLASPPERDELVVQLFHKGGGQWGEVYRDTDRFFLEVFCPPDQTVRLDVEEMIEALRVSVQRLRESLQDR